LLGDIAIECGSKGVLFPSTRNAGGSNIVVFTQQLDDRDELSTYDPHGDLPRNQDSWRDQTGSEK
jgi:RES domain-containing protein